MKDKIKAILEKHIGFDIRDIWHEDEIMRINNAIIEICEEQVLESVKTIRMGMGEMIKDINYTIPIPKNIAK